MSLVYKFKLGQFEIESIMRSETEKGIFISYVDSVHGEVAHKIEKSEGVRLINTLAEWFGIELDQGWE